MRAYTVVGLNETGTANKTLLTIVGGTTSRPRVFDVVVGSAATPADQAALLLLARWTAAGTAGSAPTPLPLDPSDVAAIATAGITHSAEPTYTAGGTLLNIPMNQRATFRWVASPGFELMNPATATTGLGLKLSTATATTIYNGQAFWFE